MSFLAQGILLFKQKMHWTKR